MHIHIKATKEEVLESLQYNGQPAGGDKIFLEAKMASLISNAIDDSVSVAGFNITVTIEDMK